MPYNLPQASAAVARDRSTILRAIQSGRLSATRDAATNSWLIEPAELFRLYPATQNALDAHQGELDTQRRNADTTSVLEAKLEAERDKVAMLERSLDEMRRRVDEERTERRQTADRLAAAQERIAALLTDQRAAPAPIRRWWRFGR